MEEEAANKQKLLVNHLNLMARVNAELPAGFNLDAAGGDMDAILQKLPLHPL